MLHVGDGSMPPVGFLVALRKDLSADESSAKIPVIEGENVVGRTELQLVVADKRISRKQVSLRASCHGPAKLVVEGRNPVVLSSAGQRKKLHSGTTASVNYGDVIELIPGSYFFKYVEVDAPRRHASSSGKEAFSSEDGGKRAHGEEEGGKLSTTKRSRLAIAGAKATAESLQEDPNPNDTRGSRKSPPRFHSGLAQSSREVAEPIRDFRFPKDSLPLLFRLMRVQGLPDWANTSAVSIGDVIEGDVEVAILSNYMVDIAWLLSACPLLKKVRHVLVIHGESGVSLEHMKVSKPANWVLHKPPLPISYGTHHSKAMILVYPQGVRVIVHTANLIYVDWNNKSQGLWMQDFPWKRKEDLGNKSSSNPFENDLVDYLSVLNWPQLTVSLPQTGQTNINVSFFRNFDYSSAGVRLIASVPGYHSGLSLKKWGHMKLKTVLEESTFDQEFRCSPLVYQFSSLGSLDEKWLAEFTASMSSGSTENKEPLGLGKPLIIWPTVEDVRCSLEGYAAGNAIPSPQKNVEKDFLKKYWAKWMASHTGRGRAMPHIKTYTRYSGQKLAWFLLTSSNLSKAAWGSLQKNNSQLMVRSYELGVLFLPNVVSAQGSVFSCTRNGGLVQNGGSHGSAGTGSSSVIGHKIEFATLCCQPGNISSDPSNKLISLPVPYELPPQLYAMDDVPWSWDRRYTKKDVYGQVWPRQVQLYTDQ